MEYVLCYYSVNCEDDVSFIVHLKLGYVRHKAVRIRCICSYGALLKPDEAEHYATLVWSK